jgi:hypothetical protein
MSEAVGYYIITCELSCAAEHSMQGSSLLLKLCAITLVVTSGNSTPGARSHHTLQPALPVAVYKC